ncbi:MAG: tRNA (guanosine(46)-N7)-methyltransferase TrmB [Desulfobacula sp.]|nr:tRNA (guanosine(46)-N7)-methyltransferase TrmB [Desulfobacula sp.]
MAKTKLHKYERVKQLSNVTFSEFGESHPPVSYPWYNERYEGMEKILELGCGKGEHSLAFAAANPHKFCVGIDGKSHRLCDGAEKAIDKGLGNIHFLRGRIERITEFFVEHSISQVWLTFPDPHPKTRSIKSRLTAAPFLDDYASLLISGGMVCLKTDSDLLYNYTRESVEQWGGHVIETSDNIYESCDHPLYAREVVSAFQKKAQAKGASIKFIAFRLN